MMNTSPLQFELKDCFDELVAESVDTEAVKKRAEAGEKLVVKLGIDPTSTDIHLGRAIPLWRLRAFQELGHKIVFIVGDFTAQVGDTSDKEAERPMLSAEKVRENMASYEKQLWMVLNPEKKEQVEFRHNSEWLGKLTFSEISVLADSFSVNTFIKRDLIAKRLNNQQRVSLREMLYPLMQGYDSVMVHADVELGGIDQWFNLLAGRVLQEKSGQPPQAVICNPLVSGTDGRKMSSSYGNVISLNSEPFVIFTGMMQIADDVLVESLQFFPRPARPFTEEELKQKLLSENPRDLKMVMAKQMVDLLFGAEVGQECHDRWQREAGNREALPETISEIALPDSSYILVQLLVFIGFASSNSDARRLVEQGGVRLDGAVVSDPFMELEKIKLVDTVLQVGKHRAVRFTA